MVSPSLLFDGSRLLPPIKVISFCLLLWRQKGRFFAQKKQKQTKQKIVTSILAIDEKNKNTKKDDGGYVRKDPIQRTVRSWPLNLT